MLFDLTFPCYLTNFSGKKCLSGKVICAFFVPLIEVLLYTTGNQAYVLIVVPLVAIDRPRFPIQFSNSSTHGTRMQKSGPPEVALFVLITLQTLGPPKDWFLLSKWWCICLMG
jgi:hypothetical protein